MVTTFAEAESESRKTREKVRRPRKPWDREERIEKGERVGVVMEGRVGFASLR